MLLLTWKSTIPIHSSSEKQIRRVYRWGTYTAYFYLATKLWTVEQHTILQENPLLEQCKKIARAAPPATIDDAWEETIVDHGKYQSIEGSLLQIRMVAGTYKEQLKLAQSLGCPIDSSTTLFCEQVFQEPMVRPDSKVPSMLSPKEVPPARQVLLGKPAQKGKHVPPARQAPQFRPTPPARQAPQFRPTPPARQAPQFRPAPPARQAPQFRPTPPARQAPPPIDPGLLEVN